MIGSIKVKKKLLSGKAKGDWKQYEVTNVSISEVLHNLQLLETILSEAGTTERFILEFREEIKANPVYLNQEFVIGNGNGYHVLEVIQTELYRLFTEPGDRIEVDRLIQSLEEDIQSTNTLPKESHSLEKSEEPVSSNQEAVTDSSEILSPPEEKEITVAEEPPRQMTKTKEKPQKNKQKSKIAIVPLLLKTFNKKVLIAIFTCLAIVSLAFIAPKWLKPSYEKLVSQEKYSQVLRYYPEREIELEQTLFKEQQIEQLRKLVAVSSSQKAAFDLAYLEQDYPTVISLADQATDSVTKAMVAVAYVKTDEVDKAYEINKTLKSDALNQLILEAYVAKGTKALKEGNVTEAERVQKIAKNATLSKNITKMKEYLSKEKELLEKQKKAEKSDKESIAKELTTLKATIEKFKKGL